MIFRRNFKLGLVFIALFGSACVLVDDSGQKKSSPSNLIATPASYYSTPKGRYLGTRYKEKLEQLAARIIREPTTAPLQFANNISSVGGIGFFTHSATKTPDERYLEVVLATPETFESKGDYSEKVSKLFDRYGLELLNILGGDKEIFLDKDLRGYGLNLAWRSVVPEGSSSRIGMARAVIYFQKEKVLDFLSRGINVSKLLEDAVIFAVEDNGPLQLVSYKPNDRKPDYRPAIREDDLASGSGSASSAQSSGLIGKEYKTAPAIKEKTEAAKPIPMVSPDPTQKDEAEKPIAKKSEPVAKLAIPPAQGKPEPTSRKQVASVGTTQPESVKAEPPPVAQLEAKASLPPPAEVAGGAKPAAPAISKDRPNAENDIAPAQLAREPASKQSTLRTEREEPPAAVPTVLPRPKEQTSQEVASNIPPAPQTNPVPGPMIEVKEPEMSPPLISKPVEAPALALAPKEAALPPTVAKKEGVPAAVRELAKPVAAEEKSAPPELPTPRFAVVPEKTPTPSAAPVEPLSQPILSRQAEEKKATEVAAPVVTPNVRGAASLQPAPATSGEVKKAEPQSERKSVIASAPKPELPKIASATEKQKQPPAPIEATIETPIALSSPPAPAPAIAEKVVEKTEPEQLASIKKPVEAGAAKDALSRTAPKPLEGFIIQIAFNDKEKAQIWAEKMVQRGYAVSVTSAGAAGSLRVRLGNFAVRDDAERQLKNLNQDGMKGIILNLPQAFRPEARSSMP